MSVSSNSSGALGESSIATAVALLMRILADACRFQPGSTTVDRFVDRFVGAWNSATAQGPVTLALTDQAVLLDSREVFRTRDARRTIPGRLRAQGVSGLMLSPGVTFTEARSIIEALQADPDDTRVDFALRLWESDQSHLKLVMEEMETRDVMLDAANLARSQADRAAITQGIQTPGDPYALRRALAALHNIANQSLSDRNADAIELVCHTLARNLAATGDLDGVIGVLDRAAQMKREPNAVRHRVGETSIAALREHAPIVALLDGVERRDNIDPHPLARCLQHLGAAAAMPFVQWLSRTRHNRAAREALRVLGPEAELLMVQLYSTSSPTDRARLRSVLLELGTHDALAAVATDFDSLVENTRVRVVELGMRSTDSRIRNAVVRGLHDKSARIRKAALQSLLHDDAPAVATCLPTILTSDVIEKRSREEVELLFEALARIGNAEIASYLVDLGKGRGLRARFRKPTPFQERCIETLRLMSSPEAREVVEEFRSVAKRSTRELLEQPFDPS